jgi:hypothetical protein
MVPVGISYSLSLFSKVMSTNAPVLSRRTTTAANIA